MILKMYVTLMPVILAGILNMIFTKTSIYNKLRKPIDGGKKLKDGKEIFGKNKTWIGFFSMIIFGIISQVVWGFLCGNLLFLNDKNYIYIDTPNTLINNIIIGAVLGFAYVICELPNSFIKRRLDITPGKTEKGIIGKLFFIIDQIDSIIGVTFVLGFWYKMPLYQFFLFILLGGFTHIAVNLILYTIKIRKNI